MTNIFKRLFGSKQKPAGSSNGMVYTYPADIRTFLDRDYRKIGYEAALQFPHAENRLYLQKSISTEFRLVLQDVGQRVDAQIVQQEQLMMQSKGISDVLEKQIESRLQQLKSLKRTLEQQLVLSVDNEGWLAAALARLELGFLNGTLQFQRQHSILKGMNTLLISDDDVPANTNQFLTP